MARIPSLQGFLTEEEVAHTARGIISVQQPDGGIPWAAGEHIDAWNHVEAAMALLVAGEVEAAESAYDWCWNNQREDGSWPRKLVGTEIEEDTADANMTAYIAAGVWHHWLVRRDRLFVEKFWPVVRRALDFVAALQLPFGGIAWKVEPDGFVHREGLLTGSSSMYHSLKCGLALADLMDQPQPEWELVLGRLRHALEEHRDLFLDKSKYSMDWYYPVLGGPLRGQVAFDHLATKWEEFVVPGLGARCVNTNPWVTGAETCELVMALDLLGDRERALTLFGDMLHTRHESGLYWTGFVYPENVFWPDEQTTYTAAAVVLALDALSRTTAGSGIFRGDGLPADPAPLALECGCSASELSAR